MILSRAQEKSLDWGDSPIRLTVREVFEHIVNLQTTDCIRYSLIDDACCCQPRSAVISPLPDLMAGQSLVIDFSSTPAVFSPYLPDYRPLEIWLANIEDWIDHLAEADLHLLISYIEADSFSSFIGRGQGKTPAGDDLLAGYITGLRWLHVEEACTICADILPKLSVTDWLSQNMITDACEGKASSVALDLCAALSETDPAALYEATSRVASTGHTSGKTWLSGFGLALFTDYYKDGRYDEAYRDSPW